MNFYSGIFILIIIFPFLFFNFFLSFIFGNLMHKPIHSPNSFSGQAFCSKGTFFFWSGFKHKGVG